MAVGASVEGALTYDPGRDAAKRLPDWVIRHRPLGGVPEVLCWRRRVILLEDSHDAAERRCSLAHAVAHIDMEHRAGDLAVLSAKQEIAADKLAARRLMPAWVMAEAMAWAFTHEEVAHELGVDSHMLDVRLRYLHPSERAYLKQRLTDPAPWA